MKKTRTVTTSRGFVLVTVIRVLTSLDLVASLTYLWKKSTLPAFEALAELRGAFDPTCGMPGPTWGCVESSCAHAESPSCIAIATMIIKKTGMKARLSNRRQG